MNADDASTATRPTEGRRTFSLQNLVAAVAVGIALFWVARSTRDALEPANYWLRRLSDGDEEQRIDAAKGLGTDDAGPAFRPRAAEALAAALADPNVRVVAEAAQSLATLIQAEPDAELARSWSDAMTAGLRDPRPDVRSLTAAAFTYTIPPQPNRRSQTASDALAALVADPDEGVRPVAIAALGACGTGEAGWRALVKVLDGDAPAANQSAAARVLGTYPDNQDEVTLALFRGLKSDRDEIRGDCNGALETRRFLGDRPRRTTALLPVLIEAAADPDRATRAHAAIILGEIGPEAVAAVPALIAMLKGPSDGPGRRIMGPAIDPPEEAAKALGLVAPGTPAEGEAAEALAAVFGEPRRPERLELAAARALGQFPGPPVAAVVPRLVAILEAGIPASPFGGRPQDGRDFDEAQARFDGASKAAEALGLVAPGTPGEAKAVAALARALGPNSTRLHTTAAEALGRFGPAAKPALPQLREMAKLEDPWRRRIAAEAARRIEGIAPAASNVPSSAGGGRPRSGG